MILLDGPSIFHCLTSHHAPIRPSIIAIDRIWLQPTIRLLATLYKNEVEKLDQNLAL
jgi:hypothetical protein